MSAGYLAFRSWIRCDLLMWQSSTLLTMCLSSRQGDHGLTAAHRYLCAAAVTARSPCDPDNDLTIGPFQNFYLQFGCIWWG